ncbi:MAG: ATP-binding protein [Oligoflexales bacterium]
MSLKIRKHILEKEMTKKISKSDSTILIVDDERNNIISLQGFLESKYRIKTASSGKEALDIIDNNKDLEIKVIISDQKMPSMTGVDFLKATIKPLPFTARIILTGYTDINEIIAAINDSKIYKFMVKPFNHDDMLLNIERAVQAYDLQKENIDLISELRSTNENLEKKVKERTKKLSEQNTKLENLYSDKRNLVRILCHDLANYVSIVQGSFRMLVNKIDVPEKYKKRINFGLNCEIEILDGVRNWEALTSGKKKLELSIIDFQDVIQKGLLLFEDRLEQKNLNISVSSNDEFKVLGELNSINNDIFNNILSNAIKFSKEGSEINIDFSEKENRRIVSIKDTGIGIPEDLLQKLFDPTAQTSRDGTSGEKGTGFGMPIVKSYMDLYGAEIEVFSKSIEEFPEQHGTTFFLKFKY